MARVVLCITSSLKRCILPFPMLCSCSLCCCGGCTASAAARFWFTVVAGAGDQAVVGILCVCVCVCVRASLCACKREEFFKGRSTTQKQVKGVTQSQCVSRFNGSGIRRCSGAIPLAQCLLHSQLWLETRAQWSLLGKLNDTCMHCHCTVSSGWTLELNGFCWKSSVTHVFIVAELAPHSQVATSS